jgi:hypothetical protein
MSPRSVLLPALVSACLLAGVAPASADTIKVPQDFNTIQAAVDAASGGDVVAIKARKNPYRENVVVGTNNLVLKGVGGLPVINAHDPLDDSDEAIDIDANGVAVRKLEIHHGAGVDCVGDDCEVSDSRFRRVGTGDCVSISGADGVVKASRFKGCDSNAVDVSGDGGRITGNKATLTDDDCFSTTGADLVFRDNTAARCEDGEGLDHSGDDAVIEDSSVKATDGDSFELNGNNLRVVGNRAAENDLLCFEVGGDDILFKGNAGDNCGDAMDLAGDDMRVINNRSAHAPDSICLDVSGDRALVTGNKVDACFRGLVVNGENPEVTGNTVSRVHTDDGLAVGCFDGGTGATACEDALVADNVVNSGGDDDETINISVSGGLAGFEIRDNVARNGLGDGLQISMDDGLIEGNVAKNSGAEEEPGFEIDGDRNDIRDNVAIGNGGEGFDIDGVDNEIRENVARDNNLNGFLILGDANALVRNLALENLGDGFENDGTNTEVKRNESTGNEHVDCSNDGTIAVNQQNDCADGSDFAVPGTDL